MFPSSHIDWVQHVVGVGFSFINNVCVRVVTLFLNSTRCQLINKIFFSLLSHLHLMRLSPFWSSFACSSLYEPLSCNSFCTHCNIHCILCICLTNHVKGCLLKQLTA